MARKVNNCGIYKITCLSNGKVYVGQSGNLIRRKQGHFNTLKKGNNKNSYLQHSFNKYGHDNFIFEVVEYCPIEQPDNQEQLWIQYYDSLNPKKGFNIAKDVIYALRGQDRSKFRKKFKFIDPNGKIIETSNLAEFCRINNISFSTVVSFFSKNNTNKSFCGGYREYKESLIGVVYDPKDSTNRLEYSLQSPNGEIFRGKNITEFCKNNNLSVGEISAVISKKRKHSKGWRLIDTKAIKGTIFLKENYYGNLRKRKYNLVSPVGEIIEVLDLKEFAKEKDLSLNALYSTASGFQKQVNGWLIS